MTHKRIFWGLAFLFLALTTLAQELSEKKAIVYSYDGTILIGDIIEEDRSKLQLQIFSGDTVRVPKAMMKKMYRSPGDVIIYEGAKLHYTSGGYFYTSYGIGGGESTSFDWDFILGMRYHKSYSLGVGLALSFNTIPLVPNQWISANFLPLFAYGRYYVTDTKRRFYVESRLGYGFPEGFGLEFNHSGGLYFQPGIGVHFASKKSRRFTLSINQLLQKTKGTDTSFDVLNNPVDVNYDLWLNRTVLRFGWEFR